jgi:hypothetical protein
MIAASMFRHKTGLILAAWVAAAITACSSQPQPESLPAATLTPSAGINDQLRAAFQIDTRPERLQAVLALLPAFLDDLARRPTDDQNASTLLTDIAFASRKMTFTDPAFIRRAGDLAVVGLPDAMGLYLITRLGGVSQAPVEVNYWTAGLDSVALTPHGSEVGLVYTTLGADNLLRVHFALLRRGEAGWGVIWLGDESPDWWFNATRSSIALAPDLTHITVVGEALETTSVFLEDQNTPRRRFRVEWDRTGDSYTPVPAVGETTNRQDWLWQIAEPSAYASLVECLERMRLRDSKGAAALTTDPAVVATAESFGLGFPENSYTVTSQDDTHITFHGRQGAFVATFQPPAPGSSADQPWLISSILPVGAAPPTPTP